MKIVLLFFLCPLLCFPMQMKREESHDYEKFSSSYANLGIEGTFYLAYRDLPQIIKKYSVGKKALDYGCGAGRSSMFLKNLGFDVVGVDISKDMILQAQKKDVNGKYHIINSGDLVDFKDNSFDLALSVVVFIEVPSKDEMLKITKEIKRVLKKDGTFILVTLSEEGYRGTWSSVLCDFPENDYLKSGDLAKTTIRNTNITFYDYFWIESDYKEILKKAKMNLVYKAKPLADGTEPFKWYDEETTYHWTIYVLKKT